MTCACHDPAAYCGSGALDVLEKGVLGLLSGPEWEKKLGGLMGAKVSHCNRSTASATHGCTSCCLDYNDGGDSAHIQGAGRGRDLLTVPAFVAAGCDSTQQLARTCAPSGPQYQPHSICTRHSHHTIGTQPVPSYTAAHRPSCSNAHAPSLMRSLCQSAWPS